MTEQHRQTEAAGAYAGIDTWDDQRILAALAEGQERAIAAGIHFGIRRLAALSLVRSLRPEAEALGRVKTSSAQGSVRRWPRALSQRVNPRNVESMRRTVAGANDPERAAARQRGRPT